MHLLLPLDSEVFEDRDRALLIPVLPLVGTAPEALLLSVDTGISCGHLLCLLCGPGPPLLESRPARSSSCPHGEGLAGLRAVDLPQCSQPGLSAAARSPREMKTKEDMPFSWEPPAAMGWAEGRGNRAKFAGRTAEKTWASVPGCCPGWRWGDAEPMPITS